VARLLIHRKLRNCRTLLRRNQRQAEPQALGELDRLAERVLSANSLDQLLGLEGLGAKAYFAAFPSMFSKRGLAFDFEHRHRRPPPDPVNALMSLAYAMLTKDWTGAAQAVGLDPHLGCLHRVKHGKPALALDLMEEFRPLIADSVVLQVINTGEISPTDFVQRGPACNLTDHGRKAFLQAYSRRMEQEVRHPQLGYAVSYRRLLLVQARLFARFCSGEIPEYPGFMTR
jgi:CRISP-associated protein Cas1